MTTETSLKHPMFAEISAKIWASRGVQKVGDETSWEHDIFGYPNEKKRQCPGNTKDGIRCRHHMAEKRLESARVIWDELNELCDGEETSETLDKIRSFVGLTHCGTHRSLPYKTLKTWSSEKTSISPLAGTYIKEAKETNEEDTTVSSLENSAIWDTSASADAGGADDTQMTHLTTDSESDEVTRQLSQDAHQRAEVLHEAEHNTKPDNKCHLHDAVTTEIDKTIHLWAGSKGIFQIQVHELAVRNLRENDAIRDLEKHQILFTVASLSVQTPRIDSLDPSGLYCPKSTWDAGTESDIISVSPEMSATRSGTEQPAILPDSKGRRAGRALRASLEGGAKKLFTHGPRRSNGGVLEDTAIEIADVKPKMWTNLVRRGIKELQEAKEAFFEDPQNRPSTSSGVETRTSPA